MHVVLSVAVALIVAVSAQKEYDTRRTSQGDVRGIYDKSTNARAWRGIPFSSSTGGPNRFAPPQPPPSWSSRDCFDFGPGCAQVGHGSNVPKSQSEDCL